jgi:hypothetical protein
MCMHDVLAYVCMFQRRFVTTAPRCDMPAISTRRDILAICGENSTETQRAKSLHTAQQRVYA